MSKITKEQLVVKYTRIIHPKDLGTETSKLETILRELIDAAYQLGKENI